jgi:tritrans,polycis-undecaprenyl-diphosphate synthase [geranylgeranyl-diphosphate specific]
MKIPKHIGVILDGNRRFAKRLMLTPEKGHEWGYKKVKELIKWTQEFKVKELTLFAFSLENFNRPKKEFDYLMDLFEKAFIELEKEEEVKNMKINFIGRIYMLPEKVQKAIFNLTEKTRNNGPFKLNFALAYGGRAEIVDATKKIAEAVKYNDLDISSINEKTIQENLYLGSDPDLIIRTSESRLSGFLLWQASYAELIFLPKLLWPEFKKENFKECLEEFSDRERRYGQ